MIIRVQEVVSLLNGLETISAMMEITMLNVALMAVIVVVMMSTKLIVTLVNVLKIKVANSKIGLATIFAMMETTMLDATLMVVIVAVKMSTHNTAPNVLA